MVSVAHFAVIGLVALGLLFSQAARAQDSNWDFGGDAGVEGRVFFHDPRWPGQSDAPLAGSISLNQEVRWRNEEGNQRARFKAFGRLDSQDSKRSHADLREAYWAYEGDGWEILLGLNRVFWGVTESRHLVDIINQTDLVEDIDQEQKLGQPMINTMLQRDWGQLDLYIMPWFRERTFPGIQGRVRAPLPVDENNAHYESADARHHTDLALRYSHFVGDLDIGTSVFHGTSREPAFVLSAAGDRLQPVYDQITQLGVDLQYTREAWLWKLEAIARDTSHDSFSAFVGGFEYTFHGLGDGANDLGILLEYLYDGRDVVSPPTVFENDVFAGTRLALNDSSDTSILAGIAVDLNSQEMFLNIEAERRLGESLSLELRLRAFMNTSTESPLHFFEQDDYAQLRLTWYH